MPGPSVASVIQRRTTVSPRSEKENVEARRIHLPIDLLDWYLASPLMSKARANPLCSEENQHDSGRCLLRFTHNAGNPLVARLSGQKPAGEVLSGAMRLFVAPHKKLRGLNATLNTHLPRAFKELPVSSILLFVTQHLSGFAFAVTSSINSPTAVEALRQDARLWISSHSVRLDS